MNPQTEITTTNIDSIMDKISEIEKKIDALKASSNEERLYSVSEACHLLHVSRRTLQKYRDEGLIPFTQVGSKILFQYADIQSFLRSNKKLTFNHVKTI